jgi:uncharacterized membrane protein
MSLSPLLSASPWIVAHAFAALAALLLGIVQLAGPKGTHRHRVLGWGWAALIAWVAISSFWIHTKREFGPFSWIHLLSIYVLLTLPIGLLAARRHRVAQHGWSMAMLFVGGLVIAGGFTLWPGRIMHAVVFGGG